MRRLGTFSIVGRCERTGQLGVAVSTADVGAGRLVTWARAGVGAVATQSWPSLYLAIDALAEMEGGASAPEALERVLREDPGQSVRQLGVVDAAGGSAAFSGDECTEWYGEVTGPNFAAQGNMLLRGDTVSGLAESFRATEGSDLDLAERLLRALEAGQAGGGDKRGRQCAALLVADAEEYPLWDLRVDEHPQPVAELRRVAEVARLDLLPFVEGLPNRLNPLGSLSDEFIEMNLLPPPQRPGGGDRDRPMPDEGRLYTPPRPPRDIPHLLLPEKRRISHWNDRHEIRVNNWIEVWDWDSPLDVGMISVPFSKTSILPNGAFAAPNALRDAWAIFTTFTPDYDVDMSSMTVRELGDVSTPIIDLMQGLQNIQECLQALMSQPEGFFPLIIGGDHAITAPAVRAYCGAHPEQQVGLIHFDAHNDVRVMDHGPTNGTPVRGILESGVKVRGENLVQFGIHGFMNASYYKRWVEGQGGTIYTARAIRKAGIDEMVGRALEIAGNGTDAIYVTVDIDVLELGYAPGTAAATADGLHPIDLLEALFVLGQDPRVAAIDFVELDPHRDVAEITSRTFGSAILTFLAGLFLRINEGWHGYDPTPIVD